MSDLRFNTGAPDVSSSGDARSQSPTRLVIQPIDDMPGFAYEVFWIDSGGEATSIEVRGIGEAIDAVRDVFAHEPDDEAHDIADLRAMADKFERETQVFLGYRNSERAAFLRRIARELARLRGFTPEDVEILRQMPAYIRGLGLGNDPNGVAAFIAGLADRIAATLPLAPADDAPKAAT